MYKNKDKGFITILSLLVMGIILISSMFLNYSSNIEYMIVNSSKNNTQALYLVEGKILTVINNPKYFDNIILPGVKEFFKYGRIKDDNKRHIILDDEDLIEGDNYKKVNLSFYREENRIILELQTNSTYNNIKRNGVAKLTVVNEIFERGIPIIFPSGLEEKDKLYKEYMEYLQREIYIPPLEENMMAVEIDDYEIINILKKIDGRTYIELYRNDIKYPIKKYCLDRDKIFLLVKNDTQKNINVNILSDKPGEVVKLNGIIYIEGDFRIYTNVEFSGIAIINDGNINVESDSKLKMKGILLVDDGEKLLDDEKIDIEYDFDDIKNTGIYLPGFIDIKIKSINIY